jgi:signal transduction histidine kinase
MKYLLLLLLLASAPSFGQSQSKAPPSPIATAQPISPAATETKMSEKDYYKMMYEQAAASAAAANNITWATFGIVGTLFGIALLIQGISNGKLNTEKLNTLRAEIEKQSASEIATGITALREEIQVLLTEQQRALLERISSDATINRDAINRELSIYKSDLDKVLASQSQEISRAKAEILMLKNEPGSAFYQFLALCEADMEAGQPPRDAPELSRTLSGFKELELPVFERVRRVLEKVQAEYPGSLWPHTFASQLASIRVYQIVPTARGFSTRENFENPLSKQS